MLESDYLNLPLKHRIHTQRKLRQFIKLYCIPVMTCMTPPDFVVGSAKIKNAG